MRRSRSAMTGGVTAFLLLFGLAACGSGNPNAAAGSPSEDGASDSESLALDLANEPSSRVCSSTDVCLEGLRVGTGFDLLVSRGGKAIQRVALDDCAVSSSSRIVTFGNSPQDARVVVGMVPSSSALKPLPQSHEFTVKLPQADLRVVVATFATSSQAAEGIERLQSHYASAVEPRAVQVPAGCDTPLRDRRPS